MLYKPESKRYGDTSNCYLGGMSYSRRGWSSAFFRFITSYSYHLFLSQSANVSNSISI